MKTIITHLFLLFYSPYTIAQNQPDCLAYKTGKFRVYGGRENIIKRTKKYQLERGEDVNIKDKIVWISDCKYKLIPIHIKKDKDGIIKNWVMYFEIIETGADYYIVRVSNKVNDFTSDFKMIKI